MIRSCIRTCLMIAGSRSGMIRFLRTEYSQRIERSPPMQAIIPAKRARETGAPPLRPSVCMPNGTRATTARSRLLIRSSVSVRRLTNRKSLWCRHHWNPTRRKVKA